ncbi:MAG: serine/threonine protein kinase [Verrucomicrobia bacterium]|nr:serine/threonine protein kinase [Verrucomicrobiota bacterium]MCH8511005.1 protein kinase [Kiritimatiellia bacterium]
MLVTFHCNHCNAKLRINANAMGSSLCCPECDGEITVPKQTLGPGFVVGGFLIKHKIGQGGMGEVYLARQLSLERDVALKLLPAQFTRQNSFVVRFLKEVHYQAKLDHPNIVAAYDAGEDNGVYFMAMAYMAGESLEEWLEREGVMSEAESLKIIRQVALALQYASDQKDIIHRDIKPANIMITPTLHAKVLDMGLSKNMLERDPTTHVDTLLGTPNYMSPEQIDSPRNIDTRSDMFSLGMTFYHMLTGKVPFEDSSYLKTLKRHGQEKLEDPRALMPGISQRSCHLLARLLARNPENRFEDWAGILECIEDAMNGKGDPVAPPDGETTVELDPEFDKGVESQETPSAERETVVTHHRSARPPPRVSRTQGIALSIAAGLVLGFAGIAVLHQLLPRPQSSRPNMAQATPTPIPLANLEDEPDRDYGELNRIFTRAILEYERNPNAHDEVLAKLLDIADLVEEHPLANQVARQIFRIREARDEAVAEQRRRLRGNAMDILQSEGAEAAREYIQRFAGGFPNEMAGEKERLLRRIQAWEDEETSRRESETAISKAQYLDLLRDITPSIISRDYGYALQAVDAAAERPSLFAMAADVAALRREIAALQSVPSEILDSYRSLIGRETSLWLRGGPQTVRIRDVLPDGMLVAKPVLAPNGTERGSVEQTILFAQLNHREILNRLEPMTKPHHDIYRGLIALNSGHNEAARFYLQAAETDLANAILREISSPLQPFSPVERLDSGMEY